MLPKKRILLFLQFSSTIFECLSTNGCVQKSSKCTRLQNFVYQGLDTQGLAKLQISDLGNCRHQFDSICAFQFGATEGTTNSSKSRCSTKLMRASASSSSKWSFSSLTHGKGTKNNQSRSLCNYVVGSTWFHAFLLRPNAEVQIQMPEGLLRHGPERFGYLTGFPCLCKCERMTNEIRSTKKRLSFCS